MAVKICIALLAVVLSGSLAFAADLTTGATAGPYAQWVSPPRRGKDPNYFPIAVWLQHPKNAAQFQTAGINLYVGLWNGPNEEQLAALEKAKMPVICGQNAFALKYIQEKKGGIIVGWMHGDEPDNAQEIRRWKSIEQIKEAWPESTKQSLKEWGTYGPPIPPKDIIADYERIKTNDPTRPVMLNLGQGVAFEKYVGRGYRSGRLEDYPQYIKGCDIVSFDIYPVVHDRPEVTGNLWFVAQGVERLGKWSQGSKVVWNCIECTHISRPPAIASGHQIRAEVWMSLISGSRGLIYFVHEFKPKFIEAGLLAHPEQLRAVTEINRQIHSLAPVLNSPTVANGATVSSSDPEVPIKTMLKKSGGETYLFAVAMRDKNTIATFNLAGVKDAAAEVLGENRTIAVKDGAFGDKFKGYEVHLYKVK